MQTEVVTYQDVTLVVSEATVLIGMKRSRLKVEGSKIAETDPDRRILRIVSYPDLVAATTQAEGVEWPLDFETFLSLPDGLAASWEEAVYRLNPHWLPTGGDGEEEKKDQKTSIDV